VAFRATRLKIKSAVMSQARLSAGVSRVAGHALRRPDLGKPFSQPGEV